MEDGRAYATDSFPQPRRFEPTYAQCRYDNLARYVRLSQAHHPRRGRAGRGRAAAAVVAGILAAVLMVNGLSGFETAISDELATPETPETPAAIASTPRHLWTRGTTPYLYQTDPAWADVPYADGTIATHGCGPTCLSMAYIQLTGKTDRDPVSMAAFSEGSGFIDTGITSWLLMSEGARTLGLQSTELPADANAVRTQLSSGHPVICSVAPGDFTTDGHFILLCGVDEAGQLIIRDPNSPERSQQKWDAQRVLTQCRNLWALSGA